MRKLLNRLQNVINIFLCVTSLQVSGVTQCLMVVRENRVVMEGHVQSPVTPRMASSANVLL